MTYTHFSVMFESYMATSRVDSKLQTRVRIGYPNFRGYPRARGASEWRVHSTLIVENLKLIKISKKSFNTI